MDNTIENTGPKPGTGTDQGELIALYVENEFIPFIQDKSCGYRSQVRKSVKYFSEYLKRPANLEDFDNTIVEDFGTWLLSHVSIKRAETLKKRLRAVWRHAGESGRCQRIVEHERPKKPKPPRTYTPPHNVIKPVMVPGTLSHFFETAYLPQRMVGANAISIRGYRAKINRWGRHLGRAVLLTDLQDATFADFLNARLQSGVRKVTVNGDRASILAVWRFAYDRGLVEKQPNVRKLRASRDEPDSWTVEEFRRIVSACEVIRHESPLGGLPPNDVLRSMILLAYWTGLRKGTMTKLLWENVDLDGRWITVPGHLMKGRIGKRFRFGEDAAASLRTIYTSPKETVLPKMGCVVFTVSSIAS